MSVGPFCSRCLVLVVSILLPGRLAAHQPIQHEEREERGKPPAGVMQRVGGVERFLESRNDESIRRFIDEHLSPALRTTKTAKEWMSYLKGIRESYRGFGTIRLSPWGESGVAVNFTECPGEGIPLLLEIETTAPHFITDLHLGDRIEAPRPREHEPAGPPLSWDNLRERLNAEAASGFSGSVLVVRDGSIVLDEGYGLANREKRIPNTAETIFAIGSTPIDFTKAAILKLEDMRKLSTADPIAKFLPDVPEDKKGITIDHLMTGRSGLRNFHGRHEDSDPDNMWIDRETAVKRILEEELLFAPGSDEAHSHSAFGLLATIVEIVSGESYARFLENHLFNPVGMEHTSNYEDIRTEERVVAIGYGGQEYAPVNSPAHWGKTSWLVMGSGGMVSTTGDLYRWNKGIREGGLLSDRAQRMYWAPPGALLTGASQNGFMTAYTEGPGSMMFLCTNDIGRDETRQLVRDLAALVSKPKFRLGIVLRVESEGIVVDAVQTDSPAKRAGLSAGDRIVAINGRSLDPDSGEAFLREQIGLGRPVELQIKRGDETITVTLAPERG